MTPKIEFVYSSTYDSALLYLQKMKWNDGYGEAVLSYIKGIEKDWRKTEKKVLKEMSIATGFKWRRKKIECFVVNHSICFSRPLTMKIRGKHEKVLPKSLFIDILTHELIHNLFEMNDIWKLNVWKGFENESRQVRAHIYVHALHKRLYLKFFGEERLIADIKKASMLDKIRPGYSRAWEIVEQYGHENLLRRLREAVKKKK